MGASLEEIADWICCGTPNRNIETRYLHYLKSIDPDLYNAAQHDYDLSLLALLFGGHDLEKFYERFLHSKKNGDYQHLLEYYQPKMAGYLTNLRQQQLMKSGGIL